MTTPQDFDRLSAYLDDQLAPADKAGLEQRLAREPKLKATLDELRVNVRLLRSLPALKPPRNFTLTRAQAPARPRFQLFPALRFATALASLAFIVVLAADWWTLNQMGASQAAPTESEMMVADVAVTQPTLTEEAYSIAATTGGEVSLTATPEMPMALVPETPTPDAARYAASEPTPTLEVLPPEGAALKNAAPFAEASVPDRSVWRWAEVGLAVLAGALGLWAWRRRRY